MDDFYAGGGDEDRGDDAEPTKLVDDWVSRTSCAFLYPFSVRSALAVCTLPLRAFDAWSTLVSVPCSHRLSTFSIRKFVAVVGDHTALTCCSPFALVLRFCEHVDISPRYVDILVHPLLVAELPTAVSASHL